MTIDLLIATFRLRFSTEDGIRLVPGERFDAFMAPSAGEPDITVNVMMSAGMIPERAVAVFDAPLMEDTDDGIQLTGKPFWSVWKAGDTTFVNVTAEGGERNIMLEMKDGSNCWWLYMNTAGTVADPLVYPLDGLILFYLACRKKAVMIHASAVDIDGRGWLFTGRSGRGKTTMAKLFDSRGFRVIHDDRLILVKEGGGWHLFNTPVYRNDTPRHAALDHIWIITHGNSNISVPVTGAGAAALILSNCIQQNWDRESADMILALVNDLAESVPVSRLDFLPDTSVCDYLLLRGSAAVTTAAGMSAALLKEGRSVTVTAGGISMWPAIRPGDRVIIEPLAAGETPQVGDVAALMRDGGFVIHRITGVINDEGGIAFQTRGDASPAGDPAARAEDIAGIVRIRDRRGRMTKIGQRWLPPLLNRLLARICALPGNRVTGTL